MRVPERWSMAVFILCAVGTAGDEAPSYPSLSVSSLYLLTQDGCCLHQPTRRRGRRPKAPRLWMTNSSGWTRRLAEEPPCGPLCGLSAKTASYQVPEAISLLVQDGLLRRAALLQGRLQSVPRCFGRGSSSSLLHKSGALRPQPCSSSGSSSSLDSRRQKLVSSVGRLLSPWENLAELDEASDATRT
eukprot:SM000093S24408  [mRNA]  locus=s93:85764:86722:+ [translate_table: standard]